MLPRDSLHQANFSAREQTVVKLYSRDDKLPDMVYYLLRNNSDCGCHVWLELVPFLRQFHGYWAELPGHILKSRNAATSFPVVSEIEQVKQLEELHFAAAFCIRSKEDGSLNQLLPVPGDQHERSLRWRHEQGIRRR